VNNLFLALIKMMNMRVVVRQLNGMRMGLWNLQLAHHFLG